MENRSTAEPLPWDSSIQGIQNLVPKKCSHYLFVIIVASVYSEKETSIHGIGRLFLGLKNRHFTSFHSGDLSTSKAIDYKTEKNGLGYK